MAFAVTRLALMSSPLRCVLRLGPTLGLTLGLTLTPLGACGPAARDEVAVVGTELLVRPAAVTLRAGEAVQLAAQVNGPNGGAIGGAPLAFAADSTGIVRVSSHGLISAAGVAGHDSVTVTSGTLRFQVPVTVTAGLPSAIEVAAGERQSGLAGATLTAPVVVTVRDAYGNAVTRATVRFSPESGGEASPAVTTTDAAGIARSRWTLGSIAGTQFLTVSADSAGEIRVSIEALARAGSMASVVNVNPVGRRTVAGDTIDVRLRAQDAFGNGVESAVFAFSVVGGGGDVAPARIESDSTGLAITRWRTGTAAGTNALLVRAFEAHDTTFQISVRTIGGAPTALRLISGDGQRARTATAVSRPPVVRVTDRFGNPVPAVRIRFFVLPADASVQPLELVTDDKGNASPRTWILGAVGDQELLVVADGIADTIRVKARATAR